MTLNEFFMLIGYGTYLVTLKYKYDFESDYTISNEVINYSPNEGYVWFNDWWEGQQYVDVVAFINIEDIDINQILRGDI